MQLKQKTMWRAAAVCLCVALSGVLGASAHAQEVKVGVLDEAKLGKEYKKLREELDALKQRAVAYDAQLDAREVLTEAEGRKLDDLILKRSRSAEEEKEFQKLVEVGGERRKDFKDLASKAARSPEEENRLKQVQTSMKANANIVQRLEDSLFEELKSQEEATTQKYVEQANAMVQKVAGDKKLTMVFRKDAVVWFAPAVDITDEVLSRLNK